VPDTEPLHNIARAIGGAKPASRCDLEVGSRETPCHTSGPWTSATATQSRAGLREDNPDKTT
jgi:hypothetical protein